MIISEQMENPKIPDKKLLVSYVSLIGGGAYPFRVSDVEALDFSHQNIPKSGHSHEWVPEPETLLFLDTQY